MLVMAKQNVQQLQGAANKRKQRLEKLELAKRKLNGEVICDNVLCEKVYSPLNKHINIKE